MKKQYETLKLVVREFSEMDVIRTSGPIQTGAEGGTGFSLDWLGGAQ